MPRIAYQKFRPSAGSLAIIDQANRILAEYQQRGIVVTLRQLYYQFVSRDIIPNKQSEYKRLGSIINDARLGGMIDWDFLQDRTRNLNTQSHWSDPSGVISSAAQSYHRDLWEGQKNYVEVWVEKDALLSVIESVCIRWDVPFFACRGYTSQSEMWGAGQRIVSKVMDEKRHCKIIHLGDHDPSGVDMTRDIHERLEGFLAHHVWVDVVHRHVKAGGSRTDEEKIVAVGLPIISEGITVNRIALNMDQIEEYEPPPNPAKLTDSRSTAYISQHGDESWELDALDPDVLTDLIENSIREYVDEDLWNSVRDRQEKEREILTATSHHWDKVRKYVEKLK